MKKILFTVFLFLYFIGTTYAGDYWKIILDPIQGYATAYMFGNLEVGAYMKGSGMRMNGNQNEFNFMKESIKIGSGDLSSSNVFGINIGWDTNQNGNYGIGFGYNSTYNNNDGIGIGRLAGYNYNNGVGVGHVASNNYNAGVGVGLNAYNNYNQGIGIGNSANGNYNWGIGIGQGSTGNHKFGIGLGAYTTSESSSVSLGAYANASAVDSMALGFGCVNAIPKSAKFREGYAVYSDSGVYNFNLGIGRKNTQTYVGLELYAPDYWTQNSLHILCTQSGADRDVGLWLQNAEQIWEPKMFGTGSVYTIYDRTNLKTPVAIYPGSLTNTFVIRGSSVGINKSPDGYALDVHGDIKSDATGYFQTIVVSTVIGTSPVNFISGVHIGTSSVTGVFLSSSSDINMPFFTAKNILPAGYSADEHTSWNMKVGDDGTMSYYDLYQKNFAGNQISTIRFRPYNHSGGTINGLTLWGDLNGYPNCYFTMNPNYIYNEFWFNNGNIHIENGNLEAEGDVSPLGLGHDSGNATFYWHEVHCSTMIFHSLIDNITESEAVDTLKKLKINDKSTYGRAYIPEKRYTKMVKDKQEEIVENAGTSLNDIVTILIKTNQNLIKRIEELEKK